MRPSPLPAGRRMGQLRRLEERLESGTNGAMDDTVANLVAGKLIGNGRIEPVTIGRG